ncbi:MAG: 4-hydroxy-3-methylbut-2-enyl diphosphate reductase [Lachnospiraceae bacterium]|nr:4-hydroxy-3-methylbut-2-enyl diphosphate reductase [Lachnospiraceae bacterium]
MDIIVAKSAGFCFGVKRAVDTAYKEVESGKNDKIYTFGPIIHNEHVLADLESKGARIVNDINDIECSDDTTVIIRAHGVSKDIYNQLNAKGIKVIDATCPFVKKIHNIVSEKSNDGYEIIIIGNANHPEVLGIKGWSASKTTVINDEESARAFETQKDAKICIVSQTTFNYNKFNKLVEIIEKKDYNSIVVNTICNATSERQTEAREIAKKVDTMLVIGSKNSSNTQKLYEICKEECKDTYYVQTTSDVEGVVTDSCVSVGITAGASTPNNIIEEVQNNVRIKF